MIFKGVIPVLLFAALISVEAASSRRSQSPPQSPRRSSSSSSSSGSDSERFSDTESRSDARPYQRNPFAKKSIPNDFRQIQDLLANELAASTLYKTVWGKAEALFAKKKQDLPAYFKSSTPDECYIAVIAYTLGTPVKVNGKFEKLYKDFNQRYRTLTDEGSWNRFPYKSFYYLINKAVPGIKNDPNPRSDSFRGIQAFHFNPAPKAGDTFYFDYFASCTTDRSVADRFAGNDGTLIEIHGGAQYAIGIDKYSRFDENEILVFPRNKFRVKKFEKRGNHDVLVLEKKL